MILFFLPAALAGVDITPSPVAGEASVVVATGADGDPRVGQTVTVVHRVGLPGEDEVAIGITDARGRVEWTPREGGVSELQVGDERLRISVGWAHRPQQTLLLISLLLFAGMGAIGYGVQSSGTARVSGIRRED